MAYIRQKTTTTNYDSVKWDKYGPQLLDILSWEQNTLRTLDGISYCLGLIAHIYLTLPYRILFHKIHTQ